MDINKKAIKMESIGQSAYAKLVNNRKNEKIEIVFTKGKLDVEVETVERINVYDNSMNIFYKEGTDKFINLSNVTYME